MFHLSYFTCYNETDSGWLYEEHVKLEDALERLKEYIIDECDRDGNKVTSVTLSHLKQRE